MVRAFALALSLLLVAPACRGTLWREGHPFLAHDVFFTLHEPGATGGLVRACERLAQAPGVRGITVGTRGAEFDRPVNDLDFHVSLRVVFDDRAGHDAYQESAVHRALLSQFEGAFEKVQVFDSWVQSY